jgi:hypothetical protein
MPRSSGEVSRPRERVVVTGANTAGVRLDVAGGAQLGMGS